jgi:hypothetical protein
MGYPVEIKVNVAAPVQDALAVLHLEDGSERRIWFLEDVTPGLDPALPLLSAGVVLRVRSGKSDDSTVKLRPCRRTQLTPDWAEDFEDEDEDEFEYRVEEDWSGKRRSLAASAVRELEPGLVAAVTEADTNPGTLFGKKQQGFLRDCSDLRIALDAVTPLGPVQATKWKDITIGNFEANVERWQAGTLDFLEMSIRVKDDPERHQRDFEAAIRNLGLSIDDDPESKTRRVLAELARTTPPTRAQNE